MNYIFETCLLRQLTLLMSASQPNHRKLTRINSCPELRVYRVTENQNSLRLFDKQLLN
jgi:hypothetical protein